MLKTYQRFCYLLSLKFSDRVSINMGGANRDKHWGAWLSAFKFKSLTAKYVASLRYSIADADRISTAVVYSIMTSDDT